MPLDNTPVRTGYTANGLAAAPIVNQQLSDWQEQQKLDFQQQGISNASAQNKLDNDLLNNPILAAERANKSTQLGYDAQNMPLANEAAMAKLQDTKSEAENAVARRRAEMVRSAATEVGDPTDPMAAANFTRVQSDLAKKGINVKDYTELVSKARGADTFIKVMDKKDEERVKTTSAEGIAAAKNNTDLEIHRMDNANRLAQTELMMQTKGTDWDRQIQEAATKVNAGIPLKPVEAVQAMAAFERSIGNHEQKTKDMDTWSKTAQGEISALRTKDDKQPLADYYKRYDIPAGTNPQIAADMVAQKKYDEKTLDAFTGRFGKMKVELGDGSTVTVGTPGGKEMMSRFMTSGVYQQITSDKTPPKSTMSQDTGAVRTPAGGTDKVTVQLPDGRVLQGANRAWAVTQAPNGVKIVSGASAPPSAPVAPTTTPAPAPVDTNPAISMAPRVSATGEVVPGPGGSPADTAPQVPTGSRTQPAMVSSPGFDQDAWKQQQAVKMGIEALTKDLRDAVAKGDHKKARESQRQLQILQAAQQGK